MNENKKMTSIARKINISFWLKHLGDIIAADVLLICLFFAAFIIKSEGEVAKDKTVIRRYFDVERQLKNEEQHFVYIVSLSDDTRIVSSLNDFCAPFELPAIAFVSLQGINLFLALFNTSMVRKKMRPLNDLAVRAQEISEAVYDTSKFDSLEQAIAKVHADSPDAHISTGDKDLQSIEIALNNLLSKMKESERQQARFVSDASHELRTPISVIQGYVNMLDRWGKEDEAVLEEAIEALKNESEHMKELIEQLLFLARGDSGRNSLHVTSFDLNEVMREVWEESVMIDETHVYELDIVGGEADAQPCMMQGDMAMLKQSIRIFVQNAAKYSEEKSVIKLGVRQSENAVSYVVQDEGIGMSGDDVVHIFERFFRSDEARNGETGGSGLGLSIAKWIVDAHDGTIDVLSRTDIGTRFTVAFPRQNN
ncbi:MAG: HAMP domain-containing histidine kinase [Clostridium sp.]|nr:HAMP domain-containing histidine kinase [Clostridium sp.]